MQAGTMEKGMAALAAMFAAASNKAPAHAEYQASRHLWDQLVLAEMCIPSSVIVKLSAGVTQLDIVDPVVVPDPRHADRALFRVRTFFDGTSIKLAFDQSAAEGLLVCIDIQPRKKSKESYNRSAVPVSASINLKQRAKEACRPKKGVVFVCHPGLLGDPKPAVLMSLVAKEARLLRLDSLPGAFNAYRLSALFCDVTLRVEGRDFPAHKMVLAAASDVFKTMFTADFKEKTASLVDLADTSAEALGKLLDYIYADSVPDWHGRELELLELADMFQLLRLKRLCEERIWLLRGKQALSLLLRAARKPVLAPAIQVRLCRQVAREAPALEGTPDWLALQTASPYTAGVVGGIMVSGSMLAPITHIMAEGLPAKEEAGKPAASGGE